MTMPSNPEHRGRVLVVDDDEPARRDFASALQGAGYQVAEAWSVVQAMRLLLSFRPDAVVLDLILPDGNGGDIGGAMRAIVTTRSTCVVAVTGNPASVPSLDPAIFGARTVLLKPVDPAKLLAAVDECFEPSGPHDRGRETLATPSPSRETEGRG